MIEIADKRNCCGCSACAAVCPVDAVTLRPDALGFMYPEVDTSVCIGCGLCEKVCDFHPAANKPGHDDISLNVYAARSSDSRNLMTSQSGGIFPVLAEEILSQGGTVYGAAFNDDFSVSHQRAETMEEADRFKGSKYVESRMEGVFRSVKADLLAGRPVLFTGTPCQVAGLASYIPDALKNDLYLVDIACHGVPSPAVWKDYVDFRQKKGRVVKADFRDKSVAGWKIHKESFLYENGARTVSETYRLLFYKNIMLRRNCEVCPYDIFSRPSDLTLADFWGIGDVMPEYDDCKGISMVVCNTSKGDTLFKKVSAALEISQTTVSGEFLKAKNPNLLRPSGFSPERDRFEKAYVERGLKYVMRRWSDWGWRYRAWKLKVLIKRIAGRK